MRLLMAVLLGLSACAAPPALAPPPGATAVDGKCQLPETYDGGYKAFCKRAPGKLGCAYLSHDEGSRLCITVVEAERCGPTKVVNKVCGIAIMVTVPEDAEVIVPPPSPTAPTESL